MPTYDFEDVKTGEAVELVFSMSDCPRVGETIKDGGRRLRRVISRPVKAAVAPDLNFTCYQIAGDEAKGAKHYDRHGSPVFTSRKEVSRFLAAKREAGVEGASYGEGWRKIDP